MCVAALAWKAHPRWRLVAIANRDEFHGRPTAPLARWENGTIAGRDLEAGGTWLGVTDAGHFAVVTNFRADGYPKAGMASRGSLVADWLDGRGDAPDRAMNPFHLIFADADTARHRTNHPAPTEHELTAGLHGVSNGAFDLPWAKTRRLTTALEAWLHAGSDDFAPLFSALADETRLPPETDSEGPADGYTSVFIRNPAYGTRCSTVVAIAHDGSGQVAERRFDSSGTNVGESTFAIAG